MLLIFILLIVILMVLTVFVMVTPHSAIDQYLLVSIQHYDVDILKNTAVTLAHVGSLYGTSLIAVLLCAVLIYQRRRAQVLQLVVGFFLTVGMTWLLKWLIARPRPEAVDPSVVATYGSSFPSAHSAYAAMLAIILVLVFRSNQAVKYWVWGVALIWAVLMGWSRVYINAHYPTDVLAGWIIAVLMMFCSAWLINKFFTKQQFV